MKNKKIIIMIMFTILLLVICLLIYRIFTNDKKIVINNLSINYDKTSNSCLNDNNCSLDGNDNYPIISVDTNSKKIKQIVNNYNKSVNELYNKITNSNLDSNECTRVKDMYKYRYTTSIYYYTYYNKRIFSIARDTYVKDLCLDTITENNYDINIYDMNTNKLLSNEDILKIYNYTEEDIIDKIKDSINIENNVSTEQLLIEDMYTNGKLNYKIYFDQNGYMIINYTSSKNNKTYSVIMTKIEE